MASASGVSKEVGLSILGILAARMRASRAGSPETTDFFGSSAGELTTETQRHRAEKSRENDELIMGLLCVLCALWLIPLFTAASRPLPAPARGSWPCSRFPCTRWR